MKLSSKTLIHAYLLLQDVVEGLEETMIEGTDAEERKEVAATCFNLEGAMSLIKLEING